MNENEDLLVDDEPVQAVETPKLALENLPTGKPHISFSEVKDWLDCSYRHRLKHVKHIDLNTPSPHLAFGTAVHAACENFIRSRTMQTSVAIDMLEKAWKEHPGVVGFEPHKLEPTINEAVAILREIPDWLDDTFPGWEPVESEHMLYETLIDRPNHAFKGFIDAVIKCPDPKREGKELYWVLDWKTCSWGWPMDKKSDPKVRLQLVYYKSFWASKKEIKPRDIRAGFVLLKKTAKAGNRCELVPVSVGDVTLRRALNVVNDMVASMKRGIAIKNRESCMFCPYRGTEHCT